MLNGQIVAAMSWWSPLLGGGLIGLSTAALLLCNGRIAGCSGIYAGVLRRDRGDWLWRFLFVAGLVVGGLVLFRLMPERFAVRLDRSAPALAMAGLLVGFGARLGNGCTSGHGVSGLSRLSLRCLVATCTFIVSGVVTTLLINRLLGGSL